MLGFTGIYNGTQNGFPDSVGSVAGSIASRSVGIEVGLRAYFFWAHRVGKNQRAFVTVAVAGLVEKVMQSKPTLNKSVFIKLRFCLKKTFSHLQYPNPG